MITTLSLNPSIDRTMTVEQFTYGGTNRVTHTRNDPSGKAVNVAITASELGVETECIGFLYEENGRMVENRLLLHGVKTDFLRQEGRVRTNIKLLDASRSIVTEINEAGVPVTQDAFQKMLELVANHAQDSDFLVLTGSLPPGCPKDFYKTVIETVDGLNCRCVLDAEGEALLKGLEAKPFLIKPNLREAETAAGHPLQSLSDVREAAARFLTMGTENVVVSMGSKGAMLVNARGAYFAEQIPVPVKSTVGAGDAMVAGLVAGFMGDLPDEDVLRMGVACATASVIQEGTQLMERETYKKFYQQIQVQEL